MVLSCSWFDIVDLAYNFFVIFSSVEQEQSIIMINSMLLPTESEVHAKNIYSDVQGVWNKPISDETLVF